MSAAGDGSRKTSRIHGRFSPGMSVYRSCQCDPWRKFSKPTTLFSLNTAQIIQSLNQAVTIIDDSDSLVYQATSGTKSMQTITKIFSLLNFHHQPGFLTLPIGLI
jgi:hypothetical protein